jgi:hypothetical protein
MKEDFDKIFKHAKESGFDEFQAQVIVKNVFDT